jgi:hypothetical protein
MAESDSLTAVALIASFTALVIALGQLLQQVFGTAEGFRRTNKEIMGLFAQSRDRVFHWSELRFETRFSTPHFTFHYPTSESSLISGIDGGVALSPNESASRKVVLAVGDHGHRVDDLNRLIKSATTLSKFQGMLNFLDQYLSSSAGPQALMPGYQAYCASWLTLLDQLYEDDKKFHWAVKGASIIHARGPPKSGKIGPDPRLIRHFAIESHNRSWDLLPLDVVRPLASISFGDLLTLCYRLRLGIRDLSLAQFSADGYGNNFSTLQVQGLGTVVQYRYDRSNDLPGERHSANTKFIPCEEADKLAFSIIPQNPLLGIEKDWKLLRHSGQPLPEAMREHFRDLGVYDQQFSQAIVQKERDKNNVWRTFTDSLLLLAPFMPIEGLGVVKYQPPISAQWLESTLWCRESRVIFRHRLDRRLPQLPPTGDTIGILPPSRGPGQAQMHWIGLVLHFFATKYRQNFHANGNGIVGPLQENAHTTHAYDLVQDVRRASQEADAYLASLFNQAHCIPTYVCLVAAHQEMAMRIHDQVNQEVREHSSKKDHKGQKKPWASNREIPQLPPGVKMWDFLVEVMHRYIDEALDGRTIIDSHTKKVKDLESSDGRALAVLSDDDIRTGWCTMILRGILWRMIHFPISRPNLPYPSQYWKDNTLILIA